jgi:hypothetical protein
LKEQYNSLIKKYNQDIKDKTKEIEKIKKLNSKNLTDKEKIDLEKIALKKKMTYLEEKKRKKRYKKQNLMKMF